MNVYTVINALLPLLNAIPDIEHDIAAAFAEHWGKDHVQQALHGLDVLNKVVADVKAAQPAQPDPVQTLQPQQTGADAIAAQTAGIIPV